MLTKHNLTLFATGYVKVFFVSVNTYLIAKELYVGVFFVAFLISLIWSFNVKKVAFGTLIDRLIYASGAAIGSLIGLLFSSYIVKLL